LSLALAACHSAKSILLTEQEEFSLAQKYMQAEKWEKAREHFQRLSDRYPGSALASEAILGKAESYFLAKDYAEAQTEYQLFLEFYPAHDKADLALYRIGVAQTEKMRGIDRDQAPTAEAIETFKKFLANYPNSQYAPEATRMLATAQDRMKRHDLYVARFYERRGVHVGALSRYRRILEAYPLSEQERAEIQAEADQAMQRLRERKLRYIESDFQAERWFAIVEGIRLLKHHQPDLQLEEKTLYYFAEALFQLRRLQEARVEFDTLVQAYPQSAFLAQARSRITELDNGVVTPAGTPSDVPDIEGEIGGP
jgi:outer membrane protein assembly factor BamD